MRRIILASGSPRRKILLQKLGVKFEIVVSDIEEILHPKLKPHQQAEYLSEEKAKEVTKKVKDSIIIAADTTVVIGDLVLGKPKDKKEAIKMLKLLSGRMHRVITGFTVVDQSSGKTITKSVGAQIQFRRLDNDAIENYINEFKPFDKAGGYGIQDIKDVFVKKMEGDYSSVLGLPLLKLSEELEKLGIKILRVKDPV